MRLDTKERLILFNQYRILEALYPQEADYFRRAQKVFADGYELSYDWYTEHITSPLSEDDCREVIDILSMYRSLGQSYEGLADKNGIAESQVRFLGFDGNNEGSHLGYADFLINDEKKFQESKNAGDGLNSHMPTLGMYRRMLKVWIPLKPKHILSKEELQTVLAAARA